MKIRDLAYQKAFGGHVKKLREEKEWSQEQLSAVSNVDGYQISRIENGVHAPNLHTIRVLAAALGKYPYELLKFDFNLKLNTDFSAKHKKKKRPGTSDIIYKIAETDFFNSPKSVADVVAQSKKAFQVILKSPATSGVLAKMVEEKILRRVPAPKKGHYLYLKRGK